MGKKLKSIILLLVLLITTIVMVIVFKEKKDKANIYIPEKEIIYSSNDCEVELSDKKCLIEGNGNDYAQIRFYMEDLKPDTFYEVSICIETENCEDVMLCGNEKDLNMKNVFSCAKDNKKQRVERIVVSDKNGSISFDLFAGTEKDGFKGNVIVSDWLIKDIDNKKYYIKSSDDELVEVIFLRKDIENKNLKSEDISEWLNLLSKFKKDLEELTNKEISVIRYVATEEFSHYGLSGNPIYINREYVSKDIERLIEDNSKDKYVLWGYIHEMCHLYDGILEEKISDWVFDTELSAQLKTVYVLNKNNLGFGDGKKAMEHFEDAIPLEKGVFSDEGFLRELLQLMILYDNDMSSLMKIEQSEKFNGNMTVYEKFEMFISIISEEMGVEIKKELSEREWEILCEIYSD